MAEITKSTEVHLESLEPKADTIVGSTRLIDHGEVILIPTPTPDPRDPLNLPEWRKLLIVINVSIFAGVATLMAASFGAILPTIYKEYHGNERVNDLVTYPALFIGLGNFIFIPIAHSVGRRPVYLFSLVMLIVCCVWASQCQSLSSHIAARNLLGIAAGQAEALCPIIVQELYFLHQRANKIAWFCALQTLGTASLTIASSYLANNIGWRWWYGVFAIINGICLFFAIFTVVETSFDRKQYETGEFVIQTGDDF
jgi:MFS family permease